MAAPNPYAVTAGTDWDINPWSVDSKEFQKWYSDATAITSREGTLDRLGFYLDLINFEVPTDIVEALQARSIEVQTLKTALYNGDLNTDYYPVRIATLPTLNGYMLSADQLLRYIRIELNLFIDQFYAEFAPYDPTLDAVWTTNEPLGAVLGIAIYPDNAAVVVSQYNSLAWVFTTVKTPGTGWHPVSGNRKFAIEANTDGTFLFYTKGVDKTTCVPETFGGLAGDLLGDWYPDVFDPFGMADGLWKSLQNGISDFVNKNGGEAEVQSSYSARHDWRWVELYLQ